MSEETLFAENLTLKEKLRVAVEALECQIETARQEGIPCKECEKCLDKIKAGNNTPPQG